MCTDTIVRQVGDIGRMVDEFSSFARMPRPTVKEEDAKEMCQQALFLQRNGNPGIRYASNLPSHAVPLDCDRRQVSQVLTNILKNSAEAIEGRDEKPDTPLPQGEITLSLREDGAGVQIVVEDNGRGPAEGRAQAADRALHDDAQQGHRPRSRDREEDHGRPWRLPVAGGSRGWRARASVWYSGETRRKSRRHAPMRQPHNDPPFHAGCLK